MHTAAKQWACITHADEILVKVPGGVRRQPGDEGIAGFLARRRS